MGRSDSRSRRASSVTGAILMVAALALALSSAPVAGATPEDSGAYYSSPVNSENWVDYVQVFWGTYGTHVNNWRMPPGPHLPMGMVKLSPTIGVDGYDWTYELTGGFGLTHMIFSPALIVAPTTGVLDVSDSGRNSYFSHNNEDGSPGYYFVHLDDFDVDAELTATTHAGFMRFTFPATDTAHIIFDLKAPGGMGFGKVFRGGMIRKVDDDTIEGYRRYITSYDRGYFNDYIEYFRAEFSKPFDSFGGWIGSEIHADIDNLVIQADIDDLVDLEDMGGFAEYSTTEGEKIMVKVGISYVSIDQARLNLETEISGWDFDGIVENAREVWNDLLGRVEVEGGTDHKKKFYTGLYRSYGRTIMTDVNWKYTGIDEDTRQTDNFPFYCGDSLWATYWNINQVWALITPDVMNNWVRGRLEFYDMGGWIDMGGCMVEYANIMEAEPAIALIVGAYMMGIRDYDVERAYEAVLKSSMVDPTGSPHAGHKWMTEYKEYGYIPPKDKDPSASMTLRYAFDDWCTAQMARAMGDEDTYTHLMECANFYRNLYNENAEDPDLGLRGFMCPKYADGSWGPTNPYNCDQFCESNGDWQNAWQYTWCVPHDPIGLAELMGGGENAAEKLNRGFEKSALNKFADTQDPVVYGDETGLQVAFMFNYWGAPWLTQKWSRAVMSAYGTSPVTFLLGDEDQGQLGGWYVMASMGLFQMTGGVRPIYLIGSPVFDRVTIHLDNHYHGGGDFVIEARNNSDENMYIQSAVLNGENWDKPWFPVSEMKGGGHLILEMGPEPNYEWGSDPEDAPPSMSTMEPPQFEYKNLEVPEEAELGDPVTISVDVKNVGGTVGTRTVELSVNGKVVDNRDVTLESGESKTVTFTIPAEEPGTYEVEVGGLTGSFEVTSEGVEPAMFELSDLSVSKTTVEPGESFTVSVVVTNTGGESGSYTVEVGIDGETKTENVALDPGASETVTFEVSLEEEGTYTVSAGTMTESVEVSAPEQPEGGEFPIIPVAAGVVAILVAVVAVFAYKRRGR